MVLRDQSDPWGLLDLPDQGVSQAAPAMMVAPDPQDHQDFPETTAMMASLVPEV